MVERHGFFDRDVFLKLTCCDIWEDALSVLGVTHPYRLASATTLSSERIFKHWRIDEKLQIESTNRLQRMAKDIPVIPNDLVFEAITNALYKDFRETDGIDSGEAMLAIVALNCPHDNKLITGDKIFLKSMESSFPKEFELLQPNIVTFEDCLLAVCNAKGFNTIHNRLRTAKKCDGTLSIALGSHETVTSDSFSAALRNYNPLKVEFSSQRDGSSCSRR